MTLSEFYYLVTILVYAGIPFSTAVLIFHKKLAQYKRLLISMAFLSAIGTIVQEPTAIAVRAWVYNYNYMLNVHFLGAEIETFLFTGFLALFVSIVAIFASEVEENNGSFIKHASHWVKRRLSRRKHMAAGFSH